MSKHDAPGNARRRALLPYSVGALLYCPAARNLNGPQLAARFRGGKASVALCLEDAIRSEALHEAQENVKDALKAILAAGDDTDRPLMFVRIRGPEHLKFMREYLGDSERVLTGYILPKVDETNVEDYLTEVSSWENDSDLTIMPILESASIAKAAGRGQNLERLKKCLDTVRTRILNIRVGGNDLCSLFGVRRSVTQTIYDIGVVRDILSDIINVFSQDYVVSGPVWEYFGEDADGAWAQGLKRELEADRLNGFIGKTAIHPSQTGIIAAGMRIPRTDYEDALRILNWNDSRLGVSRSADGSRMNEEACHSRWAARTLALAEVYGLSEDM